MTEIILPPKRIVIQDQYAHLATEQSCQLIDHGHYLVKLNKIDAAVVALRRALAISPEHPVLMSCLGAGLFDAGLYAEAEMYLRKSISIEPEYSPAHGNLGSILGAQGKYMEAKAHFRRALEIEPDFTDAKWNYSMCLLDNGDWKEAWSPYYEARKKRGEARLFPELPYPEWKGEDLNGKTLHVQGEQGVGDRILFSRYLKWIKDQYPDCKINFMLNAEDLPSCSNFFWGYRDIVNFIPNGIPWPENVDYGIYLMSIPAIHGTMPDHIPVEPGLLLKNSLRHKNSVKITARDEQMLKVGITWTGNPQMKRNAERSIPLELMLQLAEIPNVVLYSLQMGSNDLARLGADQLICDLSHQIKPFGFAGTAACILNLDLIITCCTVTAHMAGALGAPCWTLLCANPYWLWLRDRSDSIWYPNTTLFRQTTQNDWLPVIADVKASLAECAKEHARSFEKKAA